MAETSSARGRGCCRGGRSSGWTCAFLVTWLPLLAGCVLCHLALVDLLPAIRSLPQRMRTGFHEVLGFERLETAAREVHTAASQGLANCGVMGNQDCTVVILRSVPSVSNNDDSVERIQASFNRTLRKLSRVAADPYLGLDSLADASQHLQGIKAGLEALTPPGSQCSNTSLVFCRIVLDAASLLAATPDVLRAVDDLVNNEFLQAYEEQADYMWYLHFMPYLALLSALLYWHFWRRAGVCQCQTGSSRSGCCVLTLHILFWLISLVLASAICLVGIELRFDAFRLEVPFLKGTPTLAALVRHLKEEFPELWDTLLGGVPARGPELLLLAGALLEAHLLLLALYGLCACCRRPFDGFTFTKIGEGDQSFGELQQLMDSTFRDRSYQGRYKPTRLDVMEVYEISNARVDRDYLSEQRRIRRRRDRKCAPLSDKVLTQDAKDLSIAGGLDQDLNEFLLFHGTSYESARAIMRSKFRLPISHTHGGLYDKGVYFAESSTKAHMYCSDEGFSAAIFVTQVTLGKIGYITGDPPTGSFLRSKAMSGQHDSVCGDRRHLRYNFAGYREFIVYNSDQVKPRYLLFCRPRSVTATAHLESLINTNTSTAELAVAIQAAEAQGVDQIVLVQARSLLDAQRHSERFSGTHTLGDTAVIALGALRVAMSAGDPQQLREAITDAEIGGVDAQAEPLRKAKGMLMKQIKTDRVLAALATKDLAQVQHAIWEAELAGVDDQVLGRARAERDTLLQAAAGAAMPASAGSGPPGTGEPTGAASSSGEPPPRGSIEFSINVEESVGAAKLGVDVVPDSGTLKITRVKSGRLAQWNFRHQDKALCAGDRIISVNGIHGNLGNMISEFSKEGAVDISVRRHYTTEEELRPPFTLEFRVNVEKPSGGAKLGFDVDIGSGSLKVEKVASGGVLAEWNDQNPDRALRVGDTIVSVNGLQGMLLEMVNEFKKDGKLEITVLRYVTAREAPPEAPAGLFSA